MRGLRRWLRFMRRGIWRSCISNRRSNELKRARTTILERISHGESTVRNGRVIPHRKAKKRMSRWLIIWCDSFFLSQQLINRGAFAVLGHVKGTAFGDIARVGGDAEG